jgi:hypothetical protein
MFELTRSLLYSLAIREACKRCSFVPTRVVVERKYIEEEVV